MATLLNEWWGTYATGCCKTFCVPCTNLQYSIAQELSYFVDTPLEGMKRWPWGEVGWGCKFVPIMTPLIQHKPLSFRVTHSIQMQSGIACITAWQYIKCPHSRRKRSHTLALVKSSHPRLLP